MLYNDIIYMLTPSYWKYRRACQIVHKFSMDVIKKRRAILEEKKVKDSDKVVKAHVRLLASSQGTFQHGGRGLGMRLVRLYNTYY